MWPQKWYASASPGATREPTVRAPVTAISVPLTLARKPRRDSFTRAAAPRWRGRTRAAGDVGGGPGVGVADLVERPQAHQRVAAERLDGGLERAAHPTALRREDGKPEAARLDLHQFGAAPELR